MRVLYIDIDSLRADHIGAYGYHRNTTPTLDRLAREGLRFAQCYVSDAPCLPSRSSMAFGQFGIRHGAVNHGGARSEPFGAGSRRDFMGLPEAERTWFQCWQTAGYHTTSLSPFPQRHGAPWLTLGLREWINPGGFGMETANQINALALPWLEANAKQDNWLLHLQYWDAHTPYRTPESYPNPFANDPPPTWHTADVLERHRDSFGPYSARDGADAWYPTSARAGIPMSGLQTMEDWRTWIDGYDMGIRYADDHIGALIAVLERAGVLDDTLILVTSDHGENQGEHNVYGDHQTADRATCNVPFIMRYPKTIEAGQVNRGLHYQFDLTATALELAGIAIPAAWDARGITTAVRTGEDGGRDALVLSQMAWSCQRSVRFDQMLYTRTFDPGLKDFAKHALFDLESDPHEQHDLTTEHSEILTKGQALLETWLEQMRQHSEYDDPMQTVIKEGGPFHTRGKLAWYIEYLRSQGRPTHAERLEAHYTP